MRVGAGLGKPSKEYLDIRAADKTLEKLTTAKRRETPGVLAPSETEKGRAKSRYSDFR